MIKVLIVEDEELLRRGLRYTFDWKSLGCTVVEEAENGLMGMELIECLKPDIVITDIKMPVMDGLEMLQSISDRGFETIVITGFSEFEYAKKAIELNVAHFILKPIDEIKLSESIRAIKERLCERRQLEHLREMQKPINLLGEKIIVSNQHIGARYTQRIIEYVENNYNKRFTMEEMSSEMGISSGYICKIFKECTTFTFNDYLNRFRIEKSIELLKTGDYKLYEIAELTGFKEYKYYHHVFKNYLHCSPSEFLETHYLLGRN